MVRRIVLLFFVALVAFPLFAQGYHGEDYGNVYYSEVIDTSDNPYEEKDIVKAIYNHWDKDKKMWTNNKFVTDVSIALSDLQDSIFSLTLNAKIDGYPIKTTIAVGGSASNECILVIFMDYTEEGNYPKKFRVKYDSWIDDLYKEIIYTIGAMGR